MLIIVRVSFDTAILTYPRYP